MKRTGFLDHSGFQRREFFKKSMLLGTLPALGLFTMCKNKEAEGITPTEDLMREHGLLNRVLLIYDNCRLRMIDKTSFDFGVLNESARIIRDFIQIGGGIRFPAVRAKIPIDRFYKNTSLTASGGPHDHQPNYGIWKNEGKCYQ